MVVTERENTMTRKHFRAIASVLYATNASDETISAMAYEMARFNPNFDRNTFVTFCKEGK